ncbi:MAG: SpoIIE family protein phosphatase [Oscillospiraceae bacterium]|nr:SpoIIE family protein phosphatase [Oscillospiraceae bacterium]
MQHKIELISVSIREKARRLIKDYIKWLSPAGYFVAGAILSNTSIFGGISPFGVAFTAAAHGSSGTLAAFGSILGYAFSTSSASNMKYIAAVMLVAAAKWLFSPERGGALTGGVSLKTGPVSAVAASFFALLTTGLAVAFSAGGTVYDILLNVSEVFLACAAAYFFSKARAALRAGLSGAPKSEVSCVVISLAIILMGLSGLLIYDLSVGRIAAVLCILLCARYGGEAGGAVAGVAAGIAMGLSGGELTYVALAYGFGGLIAGIFGGAGRLACAASFVVTNAVVAFLTQELSHAYVSVFEVFAASTLFIAMPQSVVNRLRPMRSAAIAGDDGAGYMRGVLRDRLSDISSALLEVGKTTKKVGEGLDKLETAPSAGIATKVADKVCRKCSMKSTCWQFSYNDTARAMSAAMNVLKRSGSITRARAPRHLSQNCTRLDEVLTEFNAQFQSHAARLGTQRKVAQIRAVIADQFCALAMLIDELAVEVCGIKAFDWQKARRVRDYFEKNEGFAVGRVQVYSGDNGKLFISLVIPNHQVSRLKKTKAALDLCELLETDFDLPQITTHQQYTTVIFSEKASFHVEASACQIPGGSSMLCGDTYEFIENRAGRAHCILSDGMGSGGAAAVDSSMASGLISQLLAVGISHDTALKTVNSALIVKSGEESLATLDVTTIDLYTGRAEFYKAGAAPTFILKNKRAGYVETSSMPVGILRNVAFEHSVMSLREGDIIVMVSDGVTATGADWVKSELEALRGKDLRQMCEILAEKAKIRRNDNHEDDITVMAVELKRVA